MMLLFQSGVYERDQLLEAAIKMPDAEDRDGFLRCG
jgi:hypothetical protein